MGCGHVPPAEPPAHDVLECRAVRRIATLVLLALALVLVACRAAPAAIQQAGVCVVGCFIVGGDGETRSSLERLVRVIAESPLADVQVTLQTPFPGTPLRRRLARAGRLPPERGWAHHTLLDVAFVPDRMTVAELEDGFREVLGTVFGPAESARRAAIRRGIWRLHPRLHPCASGL